MSKKTILFFAAFFCATATVCLAQTTFDDIYVTVEPSPDAETVHGYRENRIVIENNSPDESHFVRLVMPEKPYGGGNVIRQIGRSVSVGPQSRVVVSILQPPLPLSWGNGVMLVYVDGRKHQMAMPPSSHMRGRGYLYKKQSFVLVSRSIAGDFSTIADTVLHGGEEGSPGNKVNKSAFVRSELPVTGWSANWLAFSRWDAIVLTGEDMSRLPGSVRSALTGYLACGGCLVVLGECSAPAGWRGGSADQPGQETYFAGFGKFVVIADAVFADWPEGLWRYLEDGWLESFAPWRDVKDVQEANKIFPVVENLSVPARGLFLLMLLFAIVIGPLNLLLFSRKGRRMRLLWTVPAVSILACVGVFLYAILAEGTGGHARSSALTVLNQRNHHAATIGWCGFYSPLTPSGGLNYDYNTELTPQVTMDNWRSNKGTARSVDWTDGQNLATGWVSARVPALFKVRNSQTSRRRLTVSRSVSSDGLVIVNGLGCSIKKLWLADEQGMIYSGSEIAAGAEVSLASSGDRAAGSAQALRESFTANWLGQIDDFAKKPAKRLVAGSYIAVLDGAPFIEQGLDGAKIRNDVSVVYGIIGDILDAG